MTSASEHSTRLMVVEDEAIVAADLEACLSKLGYSVVGIADNGPDALTLAHAESPDLCLVDIRLRGSMDGVDLARRLHGELGLPVVFVTAHADAATVARASLSEPFGYVVKPFDQQALRVAIEVALARSMAEKRVKQLERWLATTIQSIGDALIATDAAGNVTLMNAQAEALTEWPRGEALGRPLREVFPLEVDQQELTTAHVLAEVIEQGSVFHLRGNAWLRTRSGARKPIDDSIAPIRDERGLITGLVVVFGDRSALLEAEEQRRLLEARMHEAQRLESLGLVAGGVAHDFNNLLTVTLGNAGLCRAKLPSDSPLASYLTNIEQAARRGSALCAQMLTYAGKAMVTKGPVDLGELVRESTQLLEISVGKDARLRLELASPGPLVEGDASQLQQVVMNLVINAAEALPEGRGGITLRTFVTDLSADAAQELEPQGSAKPGRFVVLEVEDTGAGMDPEALGRMFDPFFTTKFHGRGLGLAAVRGILQAHGGAAKVRSSPGAGTTFTVYLPASTQGRVLGGAAVDTRAAGFRGKGHALVVDDEDGVRKMAGELLGELGFEVDAFADGHTAAAAAERDPTRYGLALVDLTMPHVGGVETVSSLQRVAPKLPIVLMSGYGEDRARERLEKEAVVSAFVSKPFSLDDLRRALSGALVPPVATSQQALPASQARLS